MGRTYAIPPITTHVTTRGSFEGATPFMGDAKDMVHIDDVARALDRKPPEPPIDEALGYQRVKVLSGDTYKDSSTVIIVPSRDPLFHHRVFQTWMTLMAPMNQKRHQMFVIGDEVGHAYDRMIKEILAHPDLSKWKYVLTLEADNLIPPDAHIRLLETIEGGKFDAVGGLYFTKGEINMPMAYGDPEHLKRTGELEFRPRDIRAAMANGHVMPVNGIAMGCSLYRMDLFRELEPPWFVTMNDIVPGQGPMGFTQDLWFCKNAIAKGKRFAVDMRVKVGHLDLVTGQVY